MLGYNQSQKLPIEIRYNGCNKNIIVGTDLIFQRKFFSKDISLMSVMNEVVEKTPLRVGFL